MSFRLSGITEDSLCRAAETFRFRTDKDTEDTVFRIGIIVSGIFPDHDTSERRLRAITDGHSVRCIDIKDFRTFADGNGSGSFRHGFFPDGDRIFPCRTVILPVRPVRSIFVIRVYGEVMRDTTFGIQLRHDGVVHRLLIICQSGNG